VESSGDSDFLPHLRELFEMAFSAHQAGRLSDAESLYRKLLDEQPNQTDALNRLGVLAIQTGRYEVAVDCISRAIKFRPRTPDYHYNLGLAYLNQGKKSDAELQFRTATELKPDYAEPHNNLAILLRDQGRTEEALIHFRKVVELEPSAGEARFNLTNALRNVGKLSEAVDEYKKAIALGFSSADLYCLLGVTYQQMEQFDAAINSFEHAVELNPGFAEAQFALGSAQKHLNQFAASSESYRRALSINPGWFEAHVGLNITLKSQGLLNEALENMRDTLALKPDAECHSGLIHTLNCDPNCSAEELLEEGRRWNDCHVDSLQTSRYRYSEDRSPERRLRIGYLSPDFKRHPVGFFFRSVFVEHNRAEFEVIAYSSVEARDDLTVMFAESADRWRDVEKLDNDALADMVNEDGVDILIDLAGHTYGNRLLTLALRPAPIQLCGGGHIGTTGVDGVDYLISDQFHTPAGSEKFYSEILLRLPDGYICYEPPDYAAEVKDLPARDRGYVTFGCYNNLWKVTPQVVEVWSEILSSLPGSRVRLQSAALAEDITRNRIHSLFDSHGIDSSRVELVGSVGHSVLLDNYGLIDIALDSFPYSGGLTTCEALWMGVPVITLSGEAFASRHSTSHLSNVGLEGFIAKTKEEYISVATSLARNLDYLEATRETLRSRMAASPLCDYVGYTRNLEAGLRDLWRRWCK
jgi:predicted O-linked N-acetylglucosamine transferase (SPINDLY family)